MGAASLLWPRPSISLKRRLQHFATLTSRRRLCLVFPCRLCAIDFSRRPNQLALHPQQPPSACFCPAALSCRFE